MGVALGLALLLLPGCAAIQPASRDERFVIVNHGNFTPLEIQRVRAQLDIGATALERYLGPPASERFPVEAIDFTALFGKPAEGVIDDWLQFVTGLRADTTTARRIFQSMRSGPGRR